MGKQDKLAVTGLFIYILCFFAGTCGSLYLYNMIKTDIEALEGAGMGALGVLFFIGIVGMALGILALALILYSIFGIVMKALQLITKNPKHATHAMKFDGFMLALCAIQIVSQAFEPEQGSSLAIALSLFAAVSVSMLLNFLSAKE